MTFVCWMQFLVMGGDHQWWPERPPRNQYHSSRSVAVDCGIEFIHKFVFNVHLFSRSPIILVGWHGSAVPEWQWPRICFCEWEGVQWFMIKKRSELGLGFVKLETDEEHFLSLVSLSCFFLWAAGVDTMVSNGLWVIAPNDNDDFDDAHAR